MTGVLQARERPLAWVDSAKKDFMAFPKMVQKDMGNALGLAQFGGKHPHAKPWKGEGAGVLEIVEAHAGNAYRAIYTVRFPEMVYVLHAFQKKSPHGIKTAQSDIELLGKRLKAAQEDYLRLVKTQGKG